MRSDAIQIVKYEKTTTWSKLTKKLRHSAQEKLLSLETYKITCEFFCVKREMFLLVLNAGMLQVGLREITRRWAERADDHSWPTARVLWQGRLLSKGGQNERNRHNMCATLVTKVSHHRWHVGSWGRDSACFFISLSRCNLLFQQL